MVCERPLLLLSLVPLVSPTGRLFTQMGLVGSRASLSTSEGCVVQNQSVWNSLLMASYPVSMIPTQLPNILSGHHFHSHRGTRPSTSLQRLRDACRLSHLLEPHTLDCLKARAPFYTFPMLPKPRADVLTVLLGQSKASAQCQGAPWRAPRCRSCSCPWLELQLSCHMTPVLLADLRPSPHPGGTLSGCILEL